MQEKAERIAALKDQRKYPEALELAQAAARQHPRSRAMQVILADLYEVCKLYPQAITLYRMIHEECQEKGEATGLTILIGLARSLHASGEHQVAEDLWHQLYQKIPNNPDVLAGISAIEFQKKNLAQAKLLAENALSIDPEHIRARYQLAAILLENKEIQPAIDLLETNIRRADVHGDSIDLWLKALEDLERNRYAQDTLQKLAKEFPSILEFAYGFATLANRAGEITIARPGYEAALELSPNNARILYELGVLERIAGNLDKSQALIERAITIKPDNPAALRTYASDLKYEYGDENYKRLNYVAANFTEFAEGDQIHLHYALAKASEDVGELDTAFRHYQIGGDKKRKTLTYSDKDAAKLIQIIPRVVTPSNLQNTPQTGCNSEVPVFILGMPRSGTSLMEQILSSHPDIFGAGELKFLTGILENIGLGPEMGARLRLGEKDPVFEYDLNASWQTRGERFVEKLQTLADKPYKRIVDKMPGNFNFVGLIHAILPNAKIIHSRRHPVETCLSCYRIHFAEGHQWSYNLRELGRFYKRYWQLMKYWREAFPGVMYEAVYEENVADVEGSARKLIEHLGLEWNDNCLNFYNTDRPVKTASVTQVRKPIYKTSTNRWRKYEKYLGPLLEELGDIVPEYEAEIAHLIEK